METEEGQVEALAVIVCFAFVVVVVCGPCNRAEPECRQQLTGIQHLSSFGSCFLALRLSQLCGI